MESQPKLITIEQDEYSARYIGHTQDGKQFFLTTPFEPEINKKEGNEFVALYIFDTEGKLIDSKIDQFGPRKLMDENARDILISKRLEELGKVTFDKIEIIPFSVEKFGTSFGLIPREPEDSDDVWAVEAQPGNYMAFFEPWDSGEYDT